MYPNNIYIKNYNEVKQYLCDIDDGEIKNDFRTPLDSESAYL